MQIDHKKTLDSYRAVKDSFVLVTVPPLQYLMVDGEGDPNTTPAWADALGAIYPLAYALKFASKKEYDRDYTVMPLEALWSAPDMAVFTDARDKSRWQWTAMTMVPDWMSQQDLERAVEKKGRSGVRVRLETLDEGLAVQTLHVGPFDAEAGVLAAMHDEFIPSQGLQPTGRHHEIYFSDIRKTAPEKLRTLLRQPVARV